MEINSKIHVEQPAPPGVHRQRSDKRSFGHLLMFSCVRRPT